MKDLSKEHYHIENKNIIGAMAGYNVYLKRKLILFSFVVK